MTTAIRKMNSFSAQAVSGPVQKMTFSALMLCMLFISNVIEKHFMLGWGFLQVNISIIFIFMTLVFVDYKYAILITLIQAFLGPVIVPLNSYLIDLTNNFLLFCNTAMFLTAFWLLNTFGKMKLIYSFIIAIVITALIYPWIRASLLQPLFYAAWGWLKGVDIPGTIAYYHMDFAKPFYFFIPNYWVGNFVTFGLSVIIKYSVLLVIVVPVLLRVHINTRNGYN